MNKQDKLIAIADEDVEIIYRRRSSKTPPLSEIHGFNPIILILTFSLFAMAFIGIVAVGKSQPSNPQTIIIK